MPNDSNLPIRYERDGAAAVIRLERPEKRNAFTFAMVDEVRRLVDRAAGDGDVFGIVVTGSGPAFSAGLDAGDLERSAGSGAPSAAEWAGGADELPALFSYFLRVPKPILAAVNGVAAGGGFVLAMMCDLRFAAEEASFTTVFSKRGLVAEHGTNWLLPRLVGTSRALDLLWSSRRFDAAEAHRIGFVDRVVPAAALLGEAQAYLEELAANVSPRSVAEIKTQVYDGLSQSLVDGIRDCDRRMRASLLHGDAKEGVASLLERRAPRFERLGS